MRTLYIKYNPFDERWFVDEYLSSPELLKHFPTGTMTLEQVMKQAAYYLTNEPDTTVVFERES